MSNDTHREEQELSGCICPIGKIVGGLWVDERIDPNCPVHGSRTKNMEGGGNAPGPSDVVERLRHALLPIHEWHDEIEDAISEITRLGSENERLREALVTLADRLEDDGCQCDKSDEYVFKCSLCTANDALKPEHP